MTLHPALAGVLGAVLGAVVGSFLATVFVRWPAGESALGGRSRCDGCGRALGLSELVPLLSFAWNRGRCRTCGAPIDRAHFLIELAAAAIGGAAFALAGPVAAIGWSVLGWGLLLLAALDWRHFWLPDVLTFGLAIAGLALGWTTGAAGTLDRAIGLAAGFAALWAIAYLYRILRGRDGLGGGDPKLFGAIGAWLGWQSLPFVLCAASVIGLLLVLASAAGGRRVTGTTPLPFGTLLCLAAVPGWAALHIITVGSA